MITKNSSANQNSSLADIVKRTIWGTSEKSNLLFDHSSNLEGKDCRNATNGAIGDQQQSNGDVGKTVITSDQVKSLVCKNMSNSSPDKISPNHVIQKDSSRKASLEAMNTDDNSGPEDDNDSGNDDGGDIESLNDLKSPENPNYKAKSYPNEKNIDDDDDDDDISSESSVNHTNNINNDTSKKSNAKNLTNQKPIGSLHNGHSTNHSVKNDKKKKYDKEREDGDEDVEDEDKNCQNFEPQSDCDANRLAESLGNCDNQRRLTYCEVARLSKDKLEEEHSSIKPHHEVIISHKEPRSTLTPLRALSREFHTRYLVADKA